MNKNEGKHKYVIQLSNLFKKRSEKPEAPAQNDTELGKDDEDNAAPSESTVIIEDEPQKKVAFQMKNNIIIRYYHLIWFENHKYLFAISLFIFRINLGSSLCRIGIETVFR